MLQQTRAGVVISYFEKWMELFPTIETLAAAPLEQVIKAWEGLGYYSRARYLHQGASQIMAHFGGVFPETREALSQIKGLGPYTINAVLSFAFHQKTAAVDGNVVRVLSRYFLVEDDVTRQSTKQRIQELADGCIGNIEPWVAAEALIELGATICQPKPNCLLCPLENLCLARKFDRIDSLPVKAKSTPIITLERSVAVIEQNGALLIREPANRQIMAGLHEFPYFEEHIESSLDEYLYSIWQLTTSVIEKLPTIQHSFTRYRATLFPVHLRAMTRKPIANCKWIELKEITKFAFSSGHRRILKNFLQEKN